MEIDDTKNLVRVGDLAAAAGLSVRALHHYEQIGLLSPSERSTAGHRLYGPDAVDRLYRVNRLRRLGLSLDQIGHVLDDPDGDLTSELRRHASVLDSQIARLTSLRAAISAAIANVEGDPTPNLMEVLIAMELLDDTVRRRISILVYRDLQAAHDFLVNVFGLTPGEIVLGPDGRAVHAEVYAGDGLVWLHAETSDYRLASPATLGASTATMAVMVDDVDEHHRMVAAKGGEIVYDPTDQPYGYREYSARDCEGGLWSFMKELEP
jgi:DNA-binding transcriptional MerR regulator